MAETTVNIGILELPEFQAIMTRLADFLRPSGWLLHDGRQTLEPAAAAEEGKMPVGTQFQLQAALLWPERFEVTKAPCVYQGTDEYAVRKIGSGFPPLGQIFQHYKGGRYELLAVGKGEATGQPMAVYRPAGGGQIYIRPLVEFREKFELEEAQPG
ncbi:DUF1653 domain-containing protein [Cupriavidus basilensis]|uniref:DUF1653 domain-containing protein n=1 Tax=Cupriavidus basilensis TaxID=68895 RepID=UPI0020A68110|nr:DUF1653 domain-containing protein [Cupriavidus basilensis]MCP3017477.1 DUF1653 domain-containing protein [Cupriavidus basilensis]